MLRKTTLGLLVALLLSAGSSFADTAYVTDTVTVAIFPAADLKGEPVERLMSSSLVDVLQSGNGVAEVKTKSGKTGWLRTDFLTTNLPAAIKLENAQHELSKANTELKSTKEKLSQLEKDAVALKKDAAGAKDVVWMKAEMEKARKRAVELESQLKNKESKTTEVAQQAGALEEQIATLTAEKEDMEKRLAAAMLISDTPQDDDEVVEAAAPMEFFPWSLATLIVGLGLGFAAGYYWLDRRLRQRFGGVRIY